MPAAAATAVTTHTVTPGFAASDPAIATTTVVNNYVTNPVVERVLETHSLNTSVLDERILALRNDMLLRIAQIMFPPISFSGPAATTPISVASFAPSQKIDSLTNVTLTNATVSGVSGLTDADVPDSITASNYLPLTGGTLSGDLTLAGNLTVSGAQTLSGAITIPYLSATSTSVDSNFVRLTATNATTTNATSTNFAVLGSITAPYYTATSSTASQLPYASSTAITVSGSTYLNTLTTSGTASTSALVASNSFTFSNVTGFLKAVAGAVSTALINLASDVTGILPVENGGTGWANIAASAIPYGNGSGALATTTAGTAGYVLAYLNGTPTWTATTTFSSGLTYSGGNVTLNIGNGNTWTALQQFSAGASTTQMSALDALYVGRNATTTIRGDGVASVLPYASTTALSVSGTAYFPSSGIWDSSGNVGIGITAPVTKLTVKGTTGDPTSTSVSGGTFRVDSGNGVVLDFGSITASPYSSWIQSADVSAAGNYYPIALNPSGGNVGIGTTTPGALLDVYGDGNSEKKIRLTNENTGTAAETSLYIRNQGGADNQGAFVGVTGTGFTTASGFVQDGAVMGSGLDGGLSIMTRANAPMRFYTNGHTNERMRITEAGHVGIGETSPDALLEVVDNAADGHVFMLSSSADADGDLFYVSDGGHVGIGTATVGTVASRLDVVFTGGAGTEFGVEWRPANDGTTYQYFDNAAGTGVGTINQNGTTGVNYNTTSDRRIKENIKDTHYGLADLMKLNIRDFDFIEDPTHATITGFIAQELYPIYPLAVSTNGDNGIEPLGASSTPWQVDYGRITPLIVKAVQDIANLADSFKANLIAWLADAANGITDFFADTIHARERLCVGSTCLTESQLKDLLARENVAASAGEGASDSPADEGATDTEAPVITINGNNPAELNVGDVYNDLGATVTDNADKNLGIHTFVGTTPIEFATIETKEPATYHIYYVATDNAGNTATSTRTVMIKAPTDAPTEAPADESSTPDTATSTVEQQ